MRTVTAWSGIPAAATASSYHAPAWPPSTATSDPGSPRWRAARTVFAALPPGTMARCTGRWIRPGSRRGTDTIRSIAALSETPTTRRIGSSACMSTLS